jgi:hypothetical protein
VERKDEAVSRRLAEQAENHLVEVVETIDDEQLVFLEGEMSNGLSNTTAYKRNTNLGHLIKAGHLTGRCIDKSRSLQRTEGRSFCPTIIEQIYIESPSHIGIRKNEQLRRTDTREWTRNGKAFRGKIQRYSDFTLRKVSDGWPDPVIPKKQQQSETPQKLI